MVTELQENNVASAGELEVFKAKKIKNNFYTKKNIALLKEKGVYVYEDETDGQAQSCLVLMPPTVRLRYDLVTDHIEHRARGEG